MGLTLARPEAHKLAHDLAELTGEPIEEAVTRALAERLAAERLRRDRQLTLDRARRIIHESGGADGPAPDPSDFLYDQRGLPG